MTKDFLTCMTEISGSSGYESDVSAVIKKEFEKYCDECTSDSYYNVIGICHGEKCNWQVPKILLCAHMDEVGFIVKDVLPCGFLKVVTNGGLDIRLFPGMEVMIHGKRDIKGVFSAKPPHLLKAGEDKKTVPLEEMYIDTGLDDASDVVTVGDIVTYVSPLAELKNNFVIGKTMDDRAGVAILRRAMIELKKLKFNADVYFAATVQEELGVKGAIMTGYGVNPDIGIAIDVTHGATPDAPVSTGDTVPMDKGISITVGPNIHPELCRKLCAVADENNIGYVIEANPRATGTDARALQVSHGGVPTLLLSIPLRYMHTPNEMIEPKTLDRAGKLLALFIASLGEDWKQWTNY